MTNKYYQRTNKNIVLYNFCSKYNSDKCYQKKKKSLEKKYVKDIKKERLHKEVREKYQNRSEEERRQKTRKSPGKILQFS